MSNKVRVNERGMEVKKPFTFASLGVNNIGAEDVLESNSSFTYIQGTYQPSRMAPLDNVYDPLVKHENLVGDYLHIVDNPNEFEYRFSNQKIAEALIKRAVSAISQNILIIYENGFGKLISPFLIHNSDDISKDNYWLVPVSDGINQHFVTWRDIFKPRTKEMVSTPYYTPNYRMEITEFTENTQDEVLNNSLEAIGRIVGCVASNYDACIKNLLIDKKLDLRDMAKYILESDHIDFEDIDESQYVGIVVGALNQVAAEDINKVREVAEIELMQATSEFFRDYNKAE